MAGPSTEQIVGTLGERRRDRSGLMENMRQARDANNGDMYIPLPELDRNEHPAVINFVATGIDQMGRRIGGIVPDVFYPPLREGIAKSMELARTRRRANMSWYQMNDMQSKLARRARHLVGYGESPVMLRPDSKRGIAKWEVRNPLATYPCPTGDPDDVTPTDCIFTVQRSYGWLAKLYPDRIGALNTGVGYGKRCDPSEKFDVLEYVDGDCFVLAVLGKNVNPANGWIAQQTPGAPFVELERLPNRTEMCTAVVPSRITLDRVSGQFDGAIGMQMTAAKLTALEIIAVERGIFPETYLVSRQNETARFLAGPFDGRSGQVNIIAGGDIHSEAPNPSFATTNTIDRIQNAARATGGIASEMFGESPTNVRTGKRGDAVMSTLVDGAVAEGQMTLAKSMEAENRIGVAIVKKYFGNDRKSFYLPKAGKDSGFVDYVPNQVFETDVNVVSYPLPGADQQGLIVGIGQRVASGIMSAETAAEIDPMVDDPELERRRILGEALDRAMLQGVETQASSGQIPPHFVARMKTLVLEGKSLEDAMDIVQKEAQALQATPVEQGAPEAQPGIAQAGAGAEAPTVQGPSDSQNNLAQLLGALRTPMRPNPGQAA